MPALPAAPGVIKTALSGTFTGGSVWLTRFFTHYTGTPPTNAQLLTFDAALATAFTTNLKPMCDGAVNLTQIESQDLTSATSAVDTSAVSISGTRTGGNLPDGIAAVVSYEIGRRYRGGHPRGYWPFGTTTDIGAVGNWSAGFVTASNTAINAFYTAVNAAGWTGAGTLSHVNVSYYSGFTVITSPTTGRARNVPTLRVAPTVDAITSIITRPSYGSQRRRYAFVD